MLPIKILKKSVILALAANLFFNNFAYFTYAAVDSCTVSVSPVSLNRTVEGTLTFTINNTSASNIAWVKITAPSANFMILGGGSGSFSTVQGADGIIYTGSTLDAGSSGGFDVSPLTSDNEVSESWTVQASGEGSGASPATCTGSTTVGISGDVLPPEIGDVTVSSITTSSVKMDFDTNEAATVTLYYGTTTDYGSTKSETTASTSHSFELTGLSSEVTYHYYISATDASNNTATTGDNTLLTAKSSTVTVTTTTTSTVTKLVTPTPTPTPAPDRTAPSVSLDTDFSKPFKQAPKITGRASDNKDLGSIEYSFDNRESWSVVDNIQNPNSRSTGCDFLPTALEDGNYKIKVRARDLSGNIGVSEVYDLVIDRLPPQVGGNLVSIGPQVLVPNEDGIILALAGLDQKITLSAVGGALTIDLFSSNKDKPPTGGQMFSLVKNPDNDLWSGTLSYSTSGVYQLKTKARDGAKNITERRLNTVMVLNNGRVIDGKKGIEGAIVSLFYFDNITNGFVLWDGKAYGEQNPQKTDKSGGYKLLAPAGKYYLQVEASGFRTLKTSIFTLNKSLPINTDFVLERSMEIKIGPFVIPLPDFRVYEASVKINSPQISEGMNSNNDLKNKEFPDFNLVIEGKPVTNIFLRGKPTIISFLNTWSPFVTTQIGFLEEVDKKVVSVLVIMPAESVSSVEIFKKRGGYSIPIIADPDATLVEPLSIQSLPVHFFLNKKGIIQNIRSGVLTGDELSGNVIN
jgi:hypothetical protein